MNLKVLLVEDDLDLAATVVDYLELESIICDHAANGVLGLQLLEQERYDVVLLDINMPRMDGLTLCQTLRQKGVATPILMLTARDTLDDKLQGFSAGTDDFMIKPFEMLELVARIKALSQRQKGRASYLTVGDLEVDTENKTATRSGRSLKLTPTGWLLLEVLLRQSPALVPREQLYRVIWGEDPPDSNSFKVHLFKLRQQIDADGEPKLLHTMAGQGVALRQG